MRQVVEELNSKHGLNITAGQLFFAGKALPDNKTLADLNLIGATLDLIVEGFVNSAVDRRIVLRLSLRNSMTYHYDQIKHHNFDYLVASATGNSSSCASFLYGNRVIHSEVKVSDFEN